MGLDDDARRAGDEVSEKVDAAADAGSDAMDEAEEQVKGGMDRITSAMDADGDADVDMDDAKAHFGRAKDAVGELIDKARDAIDRT